MNKIVFYGLHNLNIIRITYLQVLVFVTVTHTKRHACSMSFYGETFTFFSYNRIIYRGRGDVAFDHKSGDQGNASECTGTYLCVVSVTFCAYWVLLISPIVCMHTCDHKSECGQNGVHVPEYW